jgi:hypothetical protein
MVNFSLATGLWQQLSAVAGAVALVLCRFTSSSMMLLALVQESWRYIATPGRSLQSPVEVLVSTMRTQLIGTVGDRAD